MAKPRIDLSDFDDMLNFEQPPQPAVPISAIASPVTALQPDSLIKIDFEQMEPFPNHRFKMYEGQRLTDMVESIKQFGILLPLILWHTEEGKYIILSGHNRRNAAQLAGLADSPAIIRENLTYADAVLIVTETNLRQRSFADMSHSERAYCLAEHYEALKSQGKRNDLLAEINTLLTPHGNGENGTSIQLEQKLESREKVGQEYGLSSSKAGRYIKIATLIEPLLMKVDKGEIALLSAYDLSFVEDIKKQQQIADLMESDGCKVDMKKAELFHSYYENGRLTDTAILQILSGEKARKLKNSKPQPFKVRHAVISRYFTTQQTTGEIEETIDRALALYFKNQEQEMEGLA